jgi:hypothetical protein
MPSPERFTVRTAEGFRRLALLVGVLAGVGSLPVLQPSPSHWWVGLLFMLVIGLAAWGLVRALGWVVAGFLGRDRST